MTYCSIQMIRLLTGLDSNNISDTQLRDLRDDVATAWLNDDLNTEVYDENLSYISEDKKNTIDGSNKTFYVHAVDDNYRYISDFNDDGAVDDSDVEAYQVYDGTRNDLVVTLEDHKQGELTIEKQNGDAVSSGYIFVNYAFAPADMQTPDKMVEVACAHLTGAFGYTNIDRKNFDDFSIGAVTINNTNENSSEQMSDYIDTLQRINQREVINSGENRNNIENVFSGSGGPLNG